MTQRPSSIASMFGNLPETDSDIVIALQALRRIRSLDEKNVKYAQEIAREALKRIERHE
jgi:hypothetical protein